MDGARIFNAAIGLGVNAKELTKHVDNLMFSLSKGLCCPVGSVVVGNHEFIEKARKMRKLLGGGMRQAGIIAAPGIVALEKMVDRLKEDHDNAKLLAMKLATLDGIVLNLDRVQTNIISFDIDSNTITDELFLTKLRENKILALAQAKNKIRLVTHRGIRKEHIDITFVAIKNILEKAVH